MSEQLSSPVIDLQLQHRSVRKFLNLSITDAQIERIVAAAQRASTSSNLQVWSVVAVRDAARKKRIAEAIGSGPQVSECDVLLVWLADVARNNEVIRGAGQEPETLGNLEVTVMSSLDVGIASQNALLAAESLGLGGVFIGGIRNNPEAVAQELGLPKHTFAIVAMALGVPDPEEGTGLKPRLPLSGVLHHEAYDAEAWREAVDTYEHDYEEYFAGQGVPGRSWIRTVTSRLGKLAGLHGRDRIRQALRTQGFDSE